MTTPSRRTSDRRRSERRTQERRTALGRSCPSWQEQQVQFFTRYLFWALGLAFFNLADGIEPVWMSLSQVNLAYAVYFVVHSAIVMHASKQHYAPARFRLAMWVDIVIVSISVLNDPYSLPPSLLVFIMVVLGNGMRYGMRLFAESVAASIGALMVIFTLRFADSVQAISPGLVFLNLFGAIILVYSYILMGRIERTRRELERSSHQDTLTTLMNRRALYDNSEPLFAQALRSATPLTVMLADLDRFKAINDSLGHARGDEVLQAFADILRNNVRGADLAARFGGDEFVLILPDTNLDQAEQVARRIHEQVRAYAESADLDFDTTIAFGEAPAHGQSVDEVLHAVDAALYRAKGRSDGPGIQRVESPPQQAELHLVPSPTSTD